MLKHISFYIVILIIIVCLFVGNLFLLTSKTNSVYDMIGTLKQIIN